MKAYAVVRPAAAKRLIAKGVAAHPIVERALREGTIVITLGTTNACVAEELTGEPIDRGAFAAGVIDGRWNINARVAEGREVLVGQVAGPQVQADARGLQDLLRPGPPDPVDVGERDLHPLVAGEVDAGETCHAAGCSCRRPGTPDDRPGRCCGRAPARFRGWTAPCRRGRFVGFLWVVRRSR